MAPINRNRRYGMPPSGHCGRRVRQGLIIVAIGGNGCAASAGEWLVMPSVTFQEVVTDNAGQTESDRRADAITQFIPGVNITGQGQHSQLSLSYAPIFSAYLSEPGQDRVDQNLIGSGALDFFDRLLAIDFNAFANEGSASGNYISSSANGLVPLGDRTLNYGGVIAPHLHEQFGDTATLDGYYRVSTSNTSGGDGLFPDGGGGADLLQHEEKIALGSGNSFGRLFSEIDLDRTTGTGSGINNDFDNDTDTIRFEYHLTHEYALTGLAGYQRIHYDPTPGAAGYDNEGLTWSAGVKATPNDFTTIALSYGRQSGSYNLEAHVRYDLTPRTHIAADYTVSVENQLQANLQNLQYVSYSALGNPIDTRTGLAYNSADSQLFGSQNSLFRDKIAIVSFTREFTRSAITFVAGNELRESLAGISASDNAWYARVNYSRELNPSLRGNADIGYSIHKYNAIFQGSAGNDKIINADISLNYRINEKLFANIAYSFFHGSSNIGAYSNITNQITIGIRKEF